MIIPKLVVKFWRDIADIPLHQAVLPGRVSVIAAPALLCSSPG